MIEYRTMDKSAWLRGEWDTEPDKIQWTDITTGYPCLIVRSDLGNLCGYVGVAEGHALFGLTDEPDLEVHGGITFVNFCQHGDESDSICHIPEPGQPDRVLWFGFDCAHSGDLSYITSKRQRWSTLGTYKNIPYVREWCEKLAEQLKNLENRQLDITTKNPADTETGNQSVAVESSNPVSQNSEKV